MPLVVVHGLPAHLGPLLRQRLHPAIKNGVADIAALNVDASMVTPSYILDEDEFGDEFTICIVVTGLFIKPERTREAKQLLCDNLRCEFHSVLDPLARTGLLKKPYKVEVWTQPLNAAEDGFSSDD